MFAVDNNAVHVTFAMQSSYALLLGPNVWAEQKIVLSRHMHRVLHVYVRARVCVCSSCIKVSVAVRVGSDVGVTVVCCGA